MVEFASARRYGGNREGEMCCRILVIEDEENIADFLLTGLREEGFHAECAPDGAIGWRCLELQSWDLIVLDWSLPGQDGVTLLRRFRERDRRTPVLFLTARDHVSYRVIGLDSGADDYLCKPFDFDELLARIRALLRRRDNQSSPNLSYGDVVVNPVLQRAERAGRPLDLSTKELTLLAFFLSHPRDVLSRRRIYEQVWDESYDGLSNTLEVHVMELRRKLELLGPRVIHTVRGKGYYLGAPADADSEHGQ